MTDPIGVKKARAASEWVKHANEFAADGDGKHCCYALIPDKAIMVNATLAGLMSAYVRG